MATIPDSDFDSAVLPESKTKLEKPKLYKVILHNDDFTTMEFVVYILRTVFHRNEAEAFIIMMKVHEEGLGVAGTYTYEIAQMKSEKAIELARTQEYPLLCTVEED